jgi:phospholipid-binding lipoprotein MlaA
MPVCRAMTALVAALVVAGCALPPSSDEDVADPYETTNRRIHEFNKKVDAAAFGPAAGGYSAVPGPVRQGVLNFSENVLTPGWFVNNLMQGDLEGAGHNLFRFTMNSTLGVFGIFDPASSFSLERREADFGQTLYTWGVGPGAYIEVPVLGPWTQRDAAGFVVDLAINPVQLLDVPYPTAIIFGSWLMTLVNDRTAYSESIGQTLHESADSYAQSKGIYLQNRLFELQGGETQEYFDPYEDILD